MEDISIRPAKKLLTKMIMIFSTVSLLVILGGIILQLTIPLNGKNSSAEVASVLLPVTAGTLLLFWIIAVPISILWIKNLSYVIKAERVTAYKGILSKIEQNIPYKAITDFMLRRSLYDRVLGLGAIKIQTAGQSHTTAGYEGILSGLTEYEEIMEILRTRLQKYNAIKESGMDEPINKDTISIQILNELQEIKHILSKR